MSSRGLWYAGQWWPDPRNTRAWRKLRDQVVEDEPLCRLAYPTICTHRSETADHIATVADRPDLAMERANLRGACHRCNRHRAAHRLEHGHPAPALGFFDLAPPARRVVLIFGPPGAGKTTLAHTLGLSIYDRDDPIWDHDEERFTAALQAIGRSETAHCVVIRTGLTARARAIAIKTVRPTEIITLDTPADVCAARVRARGRGNIAHQLAAITTWWANHEPRREQDPSKKSGPAN